MSSFAAARQFLLLAALHFWSGSGSLFLHRHLNRVAANRARESYKQVLHNFQNVQYYADFKVGGQDIAGIFDTGSFELLVRSSRCEHCVHPTPPYDHNKSKTYLENGTITQHVFGSGPCKSMMGYEDIEVGPMVARNQSFWEIIDHRIEVLNSARFAAIVGIGPNFAYGNTEKTLLMSYGVEEFSICLNKESGSEGFLTWGPTEMDRKDVASASVMGQHHWATRLNNVTFFKPSPGQHLAKSPCPDTGCAVIIDSGTSLIAAPGVALMQLSEQIPPIAEDCSNLHELPDLHFVIDGNDFALPPEAYVMRVTGALMEADSVWDVLFFKPRMRKVDMCMPAFMQIELTSQFGPVWIMGMPFFRHYHTTFDRKNKEMHFAKAGPDCNPVSFTSSGTSMLAASKSERKPLEMGVDSLIPPTLSEQLDVSTGKHIVI